LEEMDDIGKENLRLTPRRMDLAALSEKVCEVHGINSGELRSVTFGTFLNLLKYYDSSRDIF